MQSQIRPTTGTPDQKESFWLQHNSQWPSDAEVPGFSEATKNFMAKCEAISKQVCEFPSPKVSLVALVNEFSECDAHCFSISGLSLYRSGLSREPSERIDGRQCRRQLDPDAYDSLHGIRECNRNLESR